MFKLLSFLFAGLTVAQNTGPALVFTDTTRNPIVGNYTIGYVNNTVENRCHNGIARFQAQQTGIVDTMVMGVYSRAQQETCGISFVLSTFPGATIVGSSLLTTFTDLVAATPFTDEFISFNASASGWALSAGANYTVTILPFTWALGPAGSTSSASHCVVDLPYGKPGVPPYFFRGQYGPTGQPCGTTPWTSDFAGSGNAIQLSLTGHAAQVIVPSTSATPSPTPTSSSTPTPSHTGTPTPSATPTGTPTITDTPTPTLSPGATSSNTASNTRTPSRTPSISYTPSPTISVTSSVTPTETPTPTPSLRIGASPSVTPTETPGPTDSPSSKPLAGLAAPITVSAPNNTSTGTIIGAAVGGGLFVVAVIGLAIRVRAVSIEVNTKGAAIKSWKKKGSRGPDIEIGTNPSAASNFGEVVVVNPASNNVSDSRLVRTKPLSLRMAPRQ